MIFFHLVYYWKSKNIVIVNTRAWKRGMYLISSSTSLKHFIKSSDWNLRNFKRLSTSFRWNDQWWNRFNGHFIKLYSLVLWHMFFKYTHEFQCSDQYKTSWFCYTYLIRCTWNRFLLQFKCFFNLKLYLSQRKVKLLLLIAQ